MCNIQTSMKMVDVNSNGTISAFAKVEDVHRPRLVGAIIDDLEKSALQDEMIDVVFQMFDLVRELKHG